MFCNTREDLCDIIITMRQAGVKNKLKVAIADFPPLIIDEKGVYTGFEIDLWEAIAKESGFAYEYEKHAFKELVPLLTEKKVDVGLAGITINERRERAIDFSHSTLDSGLLIAVNKNRNKTKIWETAKIILSEGGKMIRSAVLWVSVFVFVFANLLWFAEINANTFSKHYFPGIFESAWLVICSMSTDSFGDYVPHTWLGRVVTIGIIVGGVAIFGLLIAQVTAFLAIRKVKGEINSSRDLNNKSVGAVEGSTSESVVRKVGAKIIQVPSIGDAYQKLKNAEIDAVVFDAPAVIWYEKNDTDDRLDIVGELFDKQKYGIALQQGSPLQEKINRAVLKLKESGQYDTLYRKWFGEDLVMES